MALNVTTKNLFDDLDFIAGIMDGCKPCFGKRYYVSSDSWVGTFWRTLEGEKQATLGNSKIDEICRNASETYAAIKNGPYGKTLNEKIIKARIGLTRLVATYESLGKYPIANSIRNSGILVLDELISTADKIKYGFMLNPESNHDIDVGKMSEGENFDLE